MEFTRTIRFRLTLWYSLLIFIFALLFVISLNLIVTRYYQQTPPASIFVETRIRNNNNIPKQWLDLAEEERNRILAVRQADLEQIRNFSLLAILPLAVMSFLGGYLVAGQMLSPIKDINKAVKKLNADNFNTNIPDTGVDDELGELVDNFNAMVSRLEHSFDLQKQFVESASHELKTPLAVIQTNLDTAIADKKINKTELKTRMQTALSSVKYMNKLAEDLLLLSFQGNTLKFESVNIVKLIEEVITNLSPLATEQKVEVTLTDRIAEDTDQLVMTNKFYLSRALANLVENAIKYHNPKAKTPKVSIEIARDNGDLMLSIADNGIGIPVDDQPYIFNRFYRVDKSRSRKLGGSGLGLAITKKIIEEHHGTISVKSELNKGTIFNIVLPVKK